MSEFHTFGPTARSVRQEQALAPQLLHLKLLTTSMMRR